jgi:hypothetical protein
LPVMLYPSCPANDENGRTLTLLWKTLRPIGRNFYAREIL